MDNTKEGGFINRSTVLDGTNYDYWKTCNAQISYLLFY